MYLFGFGSERHRKGSHFSMGARPRGAKAIGQQLAQDPGSAAAAAPAPDEPEPRGKFPLELRAKAPPDLARPRPTSPDLARPRPSRAARCG